MGVEISPDSIAGVAGLLGTGLLVLHPTSKWIGWTLIFAALAVFFFDIHFSNSRPVIGGVNAALQEMQRAGPLFYLAVGLSTILIAGYLLYLRTHSGSAKEPAATPAPESSHAHDAYKQGPARQNNTMGNVTDNSGIVTQGQKGDSNLK